MSPTTTWTWCRRVATRARTPRPAGCDVTTSTPTDVARPDAGLGWSHKAHPTSRFLSGVPSISSRRWPPRDLRARSDRTRLAHRRAGRLGRGDRPHVVDGRHEHGPGLD